MNYPKPRGGKRTTPSRPKLLNRRTMLMGAVSAVGGVLLIGGATGVIPLGAEPAAADRGQVTLYKNPQCDSREGYASYLPHNGFAAPLIPTTHLTALPQNYPI